MISKSKYQKLYPKINPYNSGYLKVSGIHTLYYEEAGNPQGKPAVILHGGPGAGILPVYRRAFNPKIYRIIQFDQRGCGKSTPFAEIKENTTWDIVSDIEKLREHFKIDKWQVFGGSWGGTLALAYAENYPDRVSELVLRGVWLCRGEDREWSFKRGANYIYPEAWEDFNNFIPEDERDDIAAAYYRRMTDDDLTVQLAAAKSWCIWEAHQYNLLPNDNETDELNKRDNYALALGKLECHYTIHECWFKSNNRILENVDRIRHIPCVIVFGRYDTITPVESGWRLHKSWPEAELKIVPDAGHAFSEPGIVHELICATDRFADEYPV